MGTRNPWLPAEAPAVPLEVEDVVVPVTGAISPQPAVTPPEAGDQLRAFTTPTPARLWVVGAHGGAGESTLAQLLSGNETHHRWPDCEPKPAVLLTARTHATGLRAAQMAMRAWAAGQTPHVRLIGLALVADAPGKLPRPLADLVEVLKGGVPHMWVVPWADEYRLGVDALNPPRHVRKSLNEINAVIDSTKQ